MVGLTGALIGSAVIGAGTSLISGNKASKAAKESGAAQIAYQREKDAQDRADLAPWRETGRGALGMLAREYGIQQGSGGESAFKADPGYQYRLDQSLKALERMQSARGAWNSGATRTGLMETAGNLASQEYGNWWNRGAGLAGVGQAATNATVQAGQNSTANIMQAYQNMGNARSSAYLNAGSTANAGINNVLSAYLYQRKNPWGDGS